jgi:hypothetical protein
VWEIAEECNISIGSCHDILTTKLEMHRIVSTFVPQFMTEDQRYSRVAICQEISNLAREDKNFLKRIITCDERWVYRYDVENKTQCSQWVGKNSPRTKKAQRIISNVKVMFNLFYIEDIVRHEFLNQGQRMNRWYYIEVLKHLRENIRRGRFQLLRNSSWFLHHNNAPAHA